MQARQAQRALPRASLVYAFAPGARASGGRTRVRATRRGVRRDHSWRGALEVIVEHEVHQFTRDKLINRFIFPLPPLFPAHTPLRGSGEATHLNL